jgi:hypothetical protein
MLARSLRIARLVVASGVAALALLAGVAPRTSWAIEPAATAPPGAGSHAAQSPQAKDAPALTNEERWYSVELMGAKAGWSRTRVTTTPDAITTETSMNMTIERGETRVDVSIQSTSVETPEGKPVSMRSSTKMGQLTVEQRYKFLDDAIEVTTVQAGKSRQSREPLPREKWLPPAAAERYIEERTRAGDKSIEVTTIDPSTGPQPITMTRSGFTKETIDVGGKQFEATRATIEISNQPGAQSFEWSDASGEMLRSETTFGMLAVVMTRTDRAAAMAKGAGGQLPEVMVSTFVKPDREIDDPRGVTRGSYVLSIPAGTMPTLPGVAGQSVEPLAPDKVRVLVEVRPLAKHAPASAEGLADASLLAPSAMCDSADDRIVEFVAKALKGRENAPEFDRAMALRGAVSTHIDQKNLGVGLATASEVIRTRAGDCTEHAMLLAAALRAAKIPARVATGLIYADQFAGGKEIFGYHMWAQAIVRGEDATPRWIDLDATLPDQRFDATHIALATSDLSDGDAMQSMLAVASVLGRLSIAIESVEPDRAGGK